jgi:Arc/MetJ-type ribon-helix-helix transcriptional regulator
MALDGFTVRAMDELSRKWSISKAEVVRRAVRQLKEKADQEERLPSPLEALEWLQSGGGLVAEDAARFRAEVEEERKARRYWWEEA